MARLADSRRAVEIEMTIWDGSRHSDDWSNDFFQVGALQLDDNDCYVVQDVEYCIDQARDWEHFRGDFYGEVESNGERCVFVSDI